MPLLLTGIVSHPGDDGEIAAGTAVGAAAEVNGVWWGSGDVMINLALLEEYSGAKRQRGYPSRQYYLEQKYDLPGYKVM